MKKKVIVSIFILGVVCLSIVIVLANGEIQKMFKSDESLNIEIKEIPENFCNDPMFELLKEKYSDENEAQKAILEYGKRKALGEIYGNEEYLYSCVFNDINFFNLIKAYDFCKEIDYDISISDDMCTYFDGEDREWTKNAFYIISGKEQLNAKEKTDYIKNGLDPEKLSLAEKISLRKNCPTKEIIERILNNESCVSLLADENIENISIFSKLRLKFKNIDYENYEKIKNVIYLNEITGESIFKLLEYEDLDKELSDYKNSVKEKVRRELINKGYLNENFGKSNGEIKFEEQIYNMLLELGVTEEEISQLKFQNTDIVEIYNMKLNELNGGVNQ